MLELTLGKATGTDSDLTELRAWMRAGVHLHVRRHDRVVEPQQGGMTRRAELSAEGRALAVRCR